MTARPQDVALLQLPALEPELEDLHPGLKGFIYMYARDYARANITAALASAQVREDELRADRDSWAQQASDRAADWHAEHQRAERLEEALREIANQGPHYGRDGTRETWRHWAEIAKAALSTNAATQTGETR